MRIAYLHCIRDPEAARGGPGVHIASSTAALRELGHGVEVIGPEIDGTKAPSLAVRQRSRLRRAVASYVYEPRAILRSLWRARLDLPRVRAAQPDVILARYEAFEYAPIILARTLGVPLVWEVNGTSSEIPRWNPDLVLYPGTRALEAWALNSSAAIFVVSEELKNQLVDEGAHRDRIAVIPNGADPTRFDPRLRTERPIGDLPDEATVVGYLGSFSTWHDVETMLTVIPALAESHPDVRFVLAGARVADLTAEQRNLVAQLPDRVLFPGVVPIADAARWMARFDVALSLYPPVQSFYFSPVKLFEYMASGRRHRRDRHRPAGPSHPRRRDRAPHAAGRPRRRPRRDRHAAARRAAPPAPRPCRPEDARRLVHLEAQRPTHQRPLRAGRAPPDHPRPDRSRRPRVADSFMTEPAENKSGLVTSTLIIWTARTASPIIRMLLVVVVSRQLGAAGLGEYQIMITYPAVFEMVAALGLWPLLIRNVAREPHEAFRYLLHGSALSLVVGTLLLPLMYLSSAGYSDAVRNGILLLSFSLLPSAQVVVSEAILIARGKPQTIAMLLVAENVALVAVATGLLMGGRGVVAIAIVMLVMRVLTAVVALRLALRIAGTRVWRLERAFALTLVREAPVFLASSFVWALYSRLDVLVLSRLVSVEEVGYYAAAQRIALMCQEIPQSLLVVMFPLLATAYRRDGGEFQQLMARIAKYMVLIAIPLVVGATAVGAELLGWLFSERFQAAAPILSCFMWAFLLFGLMKLLGSGLVASDHQGADLVINVAVLVLTLGLLLALTPRIGALGAAYAMLGSVAAAVVLRATFFWRRVQPVTVEPRAGAAIAASAVMWLFLMTMHGWPLPIRIGVAGLLYAAGLMVFGAFTRAELQGMPVVGRALDRPWLRILLRNEVGNVWDRR